MNKQLAAVLLGTSALLLGACGGGSDGGSSRGAISSTQISRDNPVVAGDTAQARQARPLPESITTLTPAACGNDTLPEGGRQYRVEMPSRVDGAAIVFEVFEPISLDCQGKHPLILQGHGFSGSRSTEAGTDPLSPILPLIEAGYTVISIDQRGHGESGGTVRVMDPDYAGEDLVQIVDWAEANLDFLKYRRDNLLLGAVGGSYGGGFQYLLYNVDPDRRMDAMVPQITWHDLTDSLNPGNVTKNYWLLFLALMGDIGSGGSMDPLLRSSILDGLLQNRFPEPMLDFVHYHSPSYFFDNERGLELLDSGSTQDYLLDPITGQVPVTADGRYIVKTPRTNQYPVDVLMFQGMRDSLFPFNDAYENYLSMKKAGGDVRLLTYPFSHHYLAPNAGLVQETLESLGFYGQALPEFATDGLGPLANCGDININDATVAWFNEKLLDRGDADEVITSGQQICYTLTPGDAVTTPSVTVGGQSFDVVTPVLDTPVEVLLGANPVPVTVPLATLEADGVIAGIPTARLSVGTGSAELDAQCLDASDPILHLGTCDAMMYVGVGVIRNGLSVPELIDEQVMPVRGFGEHDIELVGIAERLQAGDQLVLMLYGQHPTFVGAFSRDLASWRVQVSGEVALPLLSPDGQSAL
ncbi:MAG: CocE/NonD family hydrolase [Marinobacter sp.]|uniref:alpha/beta hydrolase n=1 Tax=Marinobacter sp. TaxID=50741 RepID=UPI00299E1258|nr:CocE/NonD family hydrolase [Marinobacter sp.]MDX1754423.1 CocE/NonD family hydrolase [Marinobacter sp.]